MSISTSIKLLQQSHPNLAADFSRYVEKLTIHLTPFPQFVPLRERREGGKFKGSIAF
ncbi:hypothetical protein [Nostoc sp.]|uniref:hypothetical protein n=1 Tax=Nostoc sp. TaxID=1180 RepID=UPI002FFB12AC